MKRTGDNNQSVLFSRNGLSTAVKLEQFGTSNAVGLTINNKDYDFGYTTPKDQWAHLVLVGDSAKTVLYVNGTRHSTVNQSLDLPLHTIGASYQQTSHMHAQLDEVYIYDTKLNDNDIDLLYKNGKIASLPGQPRNLIINAANNKLEVTWKAPLKTRTMFPHIKSTIANKELPAGRRSPRTLLPQFRP